MDKSVEIVENLCFSTVIRAFPILWTPVENSVDKVDNLRLFHIGRLITSPMGQGEIPKNLAPHAALCRLFGWVGWGADPLRGDELCEKATKPDALRPVPRQCINFPVWEIMTMYLSKQEESAMQGKVEICGVNTSRLALLSAAEMDELLRRSKKGDQNARNRLIEGNLRLVLSVIQRFDRRGESPDDLFQVGCVGLLKAIANFDPDKEVRFSTYGVPMIAGEIRRYLRDNSVIRVSRSLRDVAYRVPQCREALTLKLGRDPSLEEISRELELPQKDISAALDAISAPVSLFDPVFTDGGDPLTVMDQVRDTKNNEGFWLEQITLREGFRRLGDREKRILRARFYDGLTQMDVAKSMHISQAQVSRLEKGAICELRKYVSVQVS